MTQRRTIQVAEFLKSAPDIVEDMFLHNAKGFPYAKVAKMINKNHGLTSELRITEHIVRAVFHRKPPFNNPDMFRFIKTELNDAVTSKFRGEKKSKSSSSPRLSPVIPEFTAEEREKAINAVNKAHLSYEQCLRHAETMGMSRNNLESLAIMTTETVLSKED